MLQSPMRTAACNVMVEATNAADVGMSTFPLAMAGGEFESWSVLEFSEEVYGVS